MARLEWRPIDAPQDSIRDVALAGANITNSFDRMGQMLMDREARLRTEATNAQAAQVLMANDEAGVAAALQQAMSTGNRRVDTNILARLVNEQRNTVLEREGLRQDNWIRGDQIQDKQALTEWSGELPALLQSHYGGDRKAMASELSRISASDSGRRFLNQRYGDAWKAFGEGVDDRREQLSDDRTHQRGLASIAAQNAANSLARDKWNFEKGRMLAGEARDARAITFADTFRDNLPANMSTPDALTHLRRTDAFKRQHPEVQAAVLARLQDKDFGRDAYLAPTMESQTRLAMSPLKPGEPGSTVGNTVAFSANDLTTQLKSLRDSASRVRDAHSARFDADNPASAMIAKAAKFKDVSADDVYTTAKGRGISKDDVEAVRAQSGGLVDYPEIMAILQDGSVRDSDYFSMRTWVGDGTLKGFLNARLDNGDYTLGGERALNRFAGKIRDLKGNEGEMSRTTGERAKLLQPAESALAEIERLDAQIQRAAAGNQLSGRERAEVLRQQLRVQALLKELEETPR